MKRVLSFVIAAMLVAGPALADKPEWAGKGKGHDRGERHEKSRGDDRRHVAEERHGKHHFHEQQIVVVREYYGDGFRAGHCPPGLAKKHNGCMPPGQAKKWHVGKPLPHDVHYYEVPHDLVVQLGAPPAGHKYVRVAADILLITVGTSMVVDAIQDLGKL